jgi:uncharacterized protein YbjT (DUF2867 family)
MHWPQVISVAMFTPVNDEARSEARMTTILITGATGTVGSQVARALLDVKAADTTIRVATRNPDKVTALTARGAEAVPLDLEDLPQVRAALADVDRVFLVGPQGDARFGTKVAAVIGAAKEAGVQHLVRLSASGSDPAQTEHLFGREHGVADAALTGSGLGYTIFQPTFFQDNLFTFQGEAIRGQSAFYGASAGGKVAYLSTRDLAEAIGRVLLDPTPHAGEVYTPTGPEAHTDEEVAALLSEVLGRNITYVEVPLEGMRASMVERGTPGWIADAMVGLERIKQRGWAAEVVTDIEPVLGRPLETLRAHVTRRKAELAA